MNYFILGTDTGVGKTVLSLLFMKHFAMAGKKPFYIKPFQTGCANALAQDSDARFIYGNLPELQNSNPAESVIYCLPEPKAPLFAARDAGFVLDMETIYRFIQKKTETFEPLVIEAAGGVFVPVTEKLRIIDIVKTTSARAVLAARAGLGTINHTLLSVEALKSRGIGEISVVFIDQTGTDQGMILENIEAVESFGGVRVSGVIGNIHDFTRIPGEYYTVIEDAAR